MSRATAISVATLALAACAAPAHADTRATCRLSVDVDFDAQGRIVQTGPGSASCAGWLDGYTVVTDPAGAHLTGFAQRGSGACAPNLQSGRVSFAPRLLLAFDTRHTIDTTASWAANLAAPVVTLAGSGAAGAKAISLSGVMRFAARAGSCPAEGFVPGRIHADLVLVGGDEPAAKDGPERSSSPAAPAPAKRSAPKRRARKAKRCARRVVRAKSGRRAVKRRCARRR